MASELIQDLKGYFYHKSSIIDEGVKIGNGTRVWHFSHVLKGSDIGRDCVIGQNVMVGPDVKIGKGCKIQNNVSVYKGVELEDGVFCGPSMVFTNVLNPRAFIERKDEFTNILVKNGATIGANATILGSKEGKRTLGEYCFVGAHSLVKDDVKAHALVVGVPAKQLGWACRCGEILPKLPEGDTNLKCNRCYDEYLLINDNLKLKENKEKTINEIEFCDLRRQYSNMKNEIDSAIQKVIEHGKFVNGPEIRQIEDKLAGFLGVRNALAVSSGTDALLVSLIACGVKQEDYIITTPFTFAATVSTIVFLGAKPILIDIDEKTYNLDVKQLESFLLNPADPITGEPISPGKLKGIVAVDLFGQAAEYEKINELAEKNNLFVIEDGAQSLGGLYKGKKNCSLADIATTSFFPAKPFGTYGEGGMIFTNSDVIAEKMRLIRNHGQTKRYEHKILGLNFRMSSIEAAVLLGKIDKFFNEEIVKRKEVAEKYDGLLQGINGITIPFVNPDSSSIYAQYCILSDKRDKLAEFLNSHGIPTAIHYPKPLHLQEAFNYLGYNKGDLPVAERVSEKILALPMDAYKTETEIEYIADKIKEFFN